MCSTNVKHMYKKTTMISWTDYKISCRQFANSQLIVQTQNHSDGATQGTRATVPLQNVAAASVREYVFYVFFRFKKTWLFTFLFEMTYQKVVKSHKKYQVCSMSIEILASMLWVPIGIYHTHLSFISCIVSCVLSKMFDVGDRDLPVLTSGNWVIIKLSDYVACETI